MATRARKAMLQPISHLFRVLTKKGRIQIMLYEQPNIRVEGVLRGFDEYMNMVLEEAEELDVKKKVRKPIGRIMLKGDNITLIMEAGEKEGSA